MEGQVPPPPLPMIQVAKQRHLDQLIDILGIQFIDAQEFHADLPVPMMIFTAQDKRFGVLCEVVGNNIGLCGMSKILNQHAAEHDLNYKKIVNVYPRFPVNPVIHSDDCRYLVSVEDVEEYLGIEVENKALLNGWFTPSDDLRYRVAAANRRRERQVYDIMEDYPDQLPQPPKKLKIHDDYTVLLQPKEKLIETDIDELQCIACCSYKKTIAQVPCEHVLYCDECFREVLKEPKLSKECHFCKAAIETIVRVKL